MRHGLAVLCFTLFAAGAALAQNGTGHVTADCATVLAGFEPAQSAGVPQIKVRGGVQSGPEGCIASGVAVEWSEGAWPRSVRADSLRWHSPQPGTVGVRVTDLRLRLRQGAGMNDLALGGLLANTGADIDAVAHHDVATGNLSIAPLMIDLPGGSRMLAEAAFSGVGQIDAIGFSAKIATLKAHWISVDVTMASSFSRTILGPLLADGRPLDTTVAAARAWLTALPPATLPPDDLRDMETLLDELPNPRGRFSLTLQSNTGIGTNTLLPLLVRGTPRAAQDWTKAFNDLKIRAVYDPTATGN